MKKFRELFHCKAMIGCALLAFALSCTALAQRSATEEGPTAALNFLIVKDDNGKPVRNASVIMHEVNAKGKQGRGDLELKTDADGKANYDEVPYGTLRVQVLASGFQTFGEDYEVNRPKIDVTIKLKRPQTQYSIYDKKPQ
ncbi:MAG: carboxypeptidase-like regulatory domain-containing protein [Candidatus Sulfotelmatobacter sp.]